MFRRRSKLLPLIACGSAYAMWGLNAPMIKTGLDSVPIFSLLFAKYLLGGVVFTWLARRAWKKLPAKINWRVILATLFGYVVVNVLLYQGIKLSGGLNASLIYLLAPIILFILSIELLKEKFSGRLLFGLCIGFLGALLIVGAPILQSGAGHSSMIGNILIVTAIIADVIGTILIKPVLSKISVLQITAIRFNIAALVMLPLVLIDLPHLSGIHLGANAQIAIAYNLLIATLIAYYIYHWGLSKVKAEEISPLHYLDPLVGAVGSIIILGEQPTTIMISGALLVMVGLYFGEFGKHLPIHLGHHR